MILRSVIRMSLRGHGEDIKDKGVNTVVREVASVFQLTQDPEAYPSIRVDVATILHNRRAYLRK